MAEIKGILFDKDGTLVDFQKTWYALADLMALHAADGDRGKALGSYPREARHLGSQHLCRQTPECLPIVFEC